MKGTEVGIGARFGEALEERLVVFEAGRREASCRGRHGVELVVMIDPCHRGARAHRERRRLIREVLDLDPRLGRSAADRKSTRLNSSHDQISYAVFCLKKKNIDR